MKHDRGENLRGSLGNDAQLFSYGAKVGLFDISIRANNLGLMVLLTLPFEVWPMQETKNLTCSAGSCLDMVTVMDGYGKLEVLRRLE